MPPKPKGWATAKVRAATLKRLDRLRSVLARDDANDAGADEKKFSVDETINALIDEYYQKQID